MDIPRPERVVILALIGLLIAGSAYMTFKWFLGYPEPAAVEVETGPRLPGMTHGAVAEAGESSRVPGSPAVPAEKEKPKIWVHVAGKVVNPGVYQLEKGARVQEAVLVAGGQAEGGRADLLNLAAPLADGEKVYVPSQVEVKAAEGSGIPPTWGSGMTGGSGGALAAGKTKLNPNLASPEALETLPGIGPALAQRIVRYRQAQGPFKRLDDLKKVPGIGERKYDELKGYLVLP